MSIRECKQCSADTIKGRQCKNRTCKYSLYCWIHTKKLFQLGLKTSGIPGTGTGLFTFKDIQPGEQIAKYTGKIKTQEEYDRNDSGYGIGIRDGPNKGKVVDAASTQSSNARYANDCQAKDKRKKHCKGNNAALLNLDNGEIWLESIKLIKKGEEIFSSYGKDYWRKEGTRKSTRKKTQRK
jgi:SET domain-containing protein